MFLTRFGGFMKPIPARPSLHQPDPVQSVRVRPSSPGHQGTARVRKTFPPPASKLGYRVQRGERETDGEYIQSNWFILLFSLSVGRFRH